MGALKNNFSSPSVLCQNIIASFFFYYYLSYLLTPGKDLLSKAGVFNCSLRRRIGEYMSLDLFSAVSQHIRV